MKNFAYLLILLSILSCRSDNKTVKPVDLHDIEAAVASAKGSCKKQSMDWLRTMLQKAEEDRTKFAHGGQYIGEIALVKGRNGSAVYTNFGLGSGGIAYYLFDCGGNPITDFETISSKNLEDRKVIYSSL